ncbi:unnamed protein product [Leptidea sinapis]|uniref:Uncharacterized protein n=1 Tax=Leptidea sinapis TaxID=189913 RepID=A0A5E4QIX8_9NEOP|nr:unnamed protein product [Leptidea sinapis]
MKSLAIVCFVALFAFVSARPELYTDRYDNVDLDEILSNRPHIKEALEENCGKCTDTQKKGTRRVIGHFINNESDYWNQLKAKYDPKNQYSMKSLAVVCLLALFVFAAARPDVYTDKYDNVDLDEILENKRLFTPYVKCILDQGKCSPDGKELKSHIKEALEQNCGKCTDKQKTGTRPHIKEALEQNCGKCTDKQKTGTRRVIGHLINNESEYWKQLKAKYDPKNQFSDEIGLFSSGVCVCFCKCSARNIYRQEALENYCAKCTEKQKQGTRTVIRHLIKNESDFWQELVNKYDPAKKYVSKYENELKTITV